MNEIVVKVDRARGLAAVGGIIMAAAGSDPNLSPCELEGVITVKSNHASFAQRLAEDFKLAMMARDQYGIRAVLSGGPLATPFPDAVDVLKFVSVPGAIEAIVKWADNVDPYRRLTIYRSRGGASSAW